MPNSTVQHNKIINYIPDGVIVTSLEGKIKYINVATEKLLNYSVAYLRNKNIEQFLVEINDDSSWKKISDIILRQKRTYVGENNIMAGNRDTICCRTSAFSIYDEKNESGEIVLIFHDITREKAIKDELSRNSIDMAKINAELIKSNKELKKVSEVKTKFLSIASHELKTPLTSIMGYSELIIDNLSDQVQPGVLRMIESISRAADRLHNVINNMLDVTRIEQNRLRLRPEDLELDHIVKGCVDELSHFCQHRNITFNCSYDNNLPTFYGDNMRIGQVFTNLFSNALKFSPDGSVIDVSIRVETDTTLHITVRDYGIGIDKEEQYKIFDPFYEVDNTVRHSTDAVKFMGGGTGLGLSIVKGIVERHGGKITVESFGFHNSINPGSSFHIYLPAKSRIQWDDDETQVIKLSKIMAVSLKDEVKDTIRHEGKKPIILIVDDDIEAIEIAKLILAVDFEIITSESGEDGLRKAFLMKPDLILLDLYLPGLNGAQICRILRSQNETKHIPISFFSAATQNEEIEGCYASGCDDFIVKPFSSKELTQKMKTLYALRNDNKNY